MRNLKLTLEYDGTHYFGFQRQPHHPTIQEALEKALSQLLSQKVKIAGASSRTDSGVHAEAQVVNFHTSHPCDLRTLQKGLNALLPPDIVVKDVREVPPEFHARYHAKWKTYEYRIWNHPLPSPLHAIRAHHVRHRLNLSAMRCAARILRGRHNFSSFCAAGGAAKNHVRHIRLLNIKREGPLVLVRIQANGFLYHMVRNIVGALIEVGKEELSVEELKKILKAKDRRLAPPTAPAGALTLVAVSY